MEQVPNYGDERQTGFCAHCGGPTESRDHVPSKIFLDEPYPSELPVVPACRACNSGFSKDEEYLACLVDCVKVGSVAVKIEDHRTKVARILKAKPALAERLRRARCQDPTGVIFAVETDRARKVVLKLARGHAAFELNEPQLEEPSEVRIVPFVSMSGPSREAFETPPSPSVWPEVGSRAMHRAVLGSDLVAGWIMVQPGRYRYMAEVADGIVVRLIIGDYLACEVVWRS